MFSIRREEVADHEAVRAIHREAFGRDAEAELVDRLRAEARPFLSLVATHGSQTVGHVCFSPTRIACEAAPATGGLAPVAVRPELQRRGVGSALVRNGLAACLPLGWKAIFVLGEPAYYERFGFVPAATRGLAYADSGPHPAFQVLEIEAGSIAVCAGRVDYHAAFAAL